MIDINDNEAFAKATQALKPGESIEVQGNGGSMTIGCPGEPVNDQPSGPPQRPQGSPDSWLS